MSELITFWELRKKLGIKLDPSLFINKPEPCGNPRLYFPFPVIPSNLFEPRDAEAARLALEEGQKLAGTWGERRSQFDTPEFQAASIRFRDATDGVRLEDVLENAREVLLRSRI